MSEELSIDPLLDAWRDWREADDDLRRCLAGCQYDAGYFCSSHQQRERAAAGRLQEAGYKFIDERLRDVDGGTPNGCTD